MSSFHCFRHGIIANHRLLFFWNHHNFVLDYDDFTKNYLLKRMAKHLFIDLKLSSFMLGSQKLEHGILLLPEIAVLFGFGCLLSL